MLPHWIAEFKDHLPGIFRPASSRSIDPVDVNPKGFFVERNGKQFAGTHLIIEFVHAINLDDLERIKAALIEATRVSGATLLHVYMHRFSEAGGVSAVVVLAESHISIHTWPQYGYAAIDIFMCGTCNPFLAIPVLRNALAPKKVKVQEFLRGEVRALDVGL